ncbi:UNVERIFIED_CONTAM: hypothetical protein Sradi_3345900 [Sesamum radiatum]|uniref:Mitochondrial protein n=1 Tax=Sesamum radiatum TaxID=300843 RepID=A0AAW2R2H6_SESRA
MDLRIPIGIKFLAGAEIILHNPEAYRRFVKRLLYLEFTRPGIAHATRQLNQFLQRPCKQHWDAAIRLVKYLKRTLHKRLFLPSKGDFKLTAYSDADWAPYVDSRRSLTGFCVFVGLTLIS